MAILIGTSTPLKEHSLGYGNQRKILEISTGTLLFFANIDDSIKYKTSTDDGETWDSSWTTVYTPGGSQYIFSFDVAIDTSNNIHCVFWDYDDSHGTAYIKLTYSSGDSWSVGSKIDIVGGSSGAANSSINIRSNGDIFIAVARYSSNLIYYRISDDGGSTWSSTSSISYPSINSVQLFPKGSDMWLIAQGNSKITYYQYTSSWDSGTDIAASGITNSPGSYPWINTTIGSIKCSDSLIFTAGRTSSGIKVYKYNGTIWDSGTLVSDSANDNSPAMSYVSTTPAVVWKDYDGADYNIVYSFYNGSTWSSLRKITDDTLEQYHPTTMATNSNEDLLLGWYYQGSASLEYIYFEKIESISSYKQTINSNASIKVVGQQQTINSDAKVIAAIEQETINADTKVVTRSLKMINSNTVVAGTYSSTINSDTQINISAEVAVDITYGSNKLFIICDTSPIKFVLVGISSGDITDINTYELDASGESYSNPSNVTVNEELDKFYISCDNGEIAKIDISSPSTREEISVGDTDALTSITDYEGFDKLFVATDSSSFEWYELDNSTIESIDTDFRFLKRIKDAIHNILSFVFDYTIETDFRFLKVETDNINTNLRFNLVEYSEIGDNIITRNDFHVYINDTELSEPDVILPSIQIRLNVDDDATAAVTLARKHDRLNYTLDGTYNQITNNNSVKIYIQNKLIISGIISKIDCSNSSESVILEIRADEYGRNVSAKLLALPSLNAQLHPYDVLINEISINNPYIDPNDDDPEYYKGTQVDKGIWEYESLDKYYGWYFGMTSEEFENFVPDPNYTYFWYVTGYNFVTGGSFSHEYIGTSLASTTTDTYIITNIAYNKQRIRSNNRRSLGTYEVGSEPYQVISVKNGEYTALWHWQDREDGLYSVLNPRWAYINYAKAVADVEYQKLTNINGAILPRTSASITQTIDAFVYYDIKLLQRINITNTTESGIYAGSNGFPLSVKNITISAQSMSVILIMDNEWATSELDAFDDTLPEEPTQSSEFAYRVNRKYDLARGGYVD